MIPPTPSKLRHHNIETSSCIQIPSDRRRKVDILVDLPHEALTPQETEKSQLVLTGPYWEQSGGSIGNKACIGLPTTFVKFSNILFPFDIQKAHALYITTRKHKSIRKL